MKITNNLGINPDVWASKKFEDFEKLCKGKMLPSEIKKKWDEFKTKCPTAKKLVVKDLNKDKGAS